MPSQHIWTEKDEEGRKREVRATKFGGVWRLQAKLKDDPEWTYYDVPLLEDFSPFAKQCDSSPLPSPRTRRRGIQDSIPHRTRKRLPKFFLLSLSQRERTKVRDFCERDLRA